MPFPKLKEEKKGKMNRGEKKENTRVAYRALISF